jgi:regulator of replication initiation timing
VKYIKKKEDAYEEGGDVEYNQLMDWAINKFKSRKEAGTLGNKTTEEETIIALQAQIKKLVSTKGKDKFKPNKKRAQEMESWMKEAPQEGQSKTKKLNNQKFHWCHHHSLWTRHSPEECHKAKSKKAESNNKGTKEGGKAKMDKALTTVAYEVSEEEEE